MTLPTLTTKRLTLRPHERADFPQYATFLASDRARFMGGPHSESKAWAWFCNDIACWQLSNHGHLIITLTDTGETVGHTGISNGEEPELGWFLFDGHENNGYATEAAAAMRDFGFKTAQLPTIVSYIAPENTSSIRVAERLGAALDANAAKPDPEDLVYRHPAPEALQ